MIIKHPDIKVVAKIPADFNRAKGQEVTENILQRFKPGQLDAIYYMADEMPFGGLQAIKAAKRLHEFKIVSVDGEKEALDMVRAGDFDYEAKFHPDDQAVAIRILCDIVNGRKPDLANQTYDGRKMDIVKYEAMPWVRPTVYPIDKSNADLPENKGWLLKDRRQRASPADRRRARRWVTLTRGRPRKGPRLSNRMDEPMAPVLDMQDIEKTYPGVKALQGVSLRGPGRGARAARRKRRRQIDVDENLAGAVRKTPARFASRAGKSTSAGRDMRANSASPSYTRNSAYCRTSASRRTSSSAGCRRAGMPWLVDWGVCHERSADLLAQVGLAVDPRTSHRSSRSPSGKWWRSPRRSPKRRRS